MTPALLASFRAPDALPAPGTPPLPILWRGRHLFTQDHVAALLGSLGLAVPLPRALRGALSPLVVPDAERALEAACAACPALRREVDAATAEGRRASVQAVPVALGAPPCVERSEDDRRVEPERAEEALPPSAEARGLTWSGDAVHAQQPAPAATAAQGARKDEGPGALRAAEPNESRGEHAVPGRYPQPTAAPPAAQGWADLARLSAEVDASPYLVETPAHPLTPPRRSPLADTGLPDWPRIRREAQEYAPGPLGLFLWQENALTSNGFHGVSPWWMWTVENFFASMKRWLLVLAGRGGAKSTIATRLASLAVDTERRIPPGQTWIYPFVSVRLGDARRRLFEIKEILERAYGITDTDADGNPAVDGKGMPKPLKVTSPEGTPTLPLLDSRGHSIAFTSFAATLGNVSGPNAIGATVDEEEKLAQDEEGKPAKANPSSEIIGSLIATFRARQGIRGTRISSAMTAQGSLYTSMKEGPTLTNFIATIGARWLADAVAGALEVARWEEEQKRDHAAAATLRAHAASLKADSIMVPSWVANTMYGATPQAGAVALRIEVEGLPPAKLEGLTKAGYFLREYCSRPTGLAEESDGEEWAILGEEHRNVGLVSEERGYG